MNPQDKSIQIDCVENGWIIRPFSYRDPGIAAGSFVAGDSDQLAELVRVWAGKQEMLPRKSNDS